jgi:hypothetical protein
MLESEAYRKCGTLAQLVEQRTFNPLVTSSNLVRPTTLMLHDLSCCFRRQQKYFEVSLQERLQKYAILEGFADRSGARREK